MKKYLLLLFYLFIASLNLNLILKPLNLVTGGTQGLVLILNSIIKLSPSLLICIINIIALIISLILLDKDHTKSALISTFAYPLFVKVTSYIPDIFISKNYYLLFTIIAGITYGITCGNIYKLGFSSGGITILNLLINKYLHIKLSLINFISNALIILASYFVFNLEKSFYSFIVIVLGSIVIHFILHFSSKSI